MSQPPYQQRVVEEKRELDEKLEKLRDFIFHNAVFRTLPPRERQLLVRQQTAMATYSRVLRERIETFETPGDDEAWGN